MTDTTEKLAMKPAYPIEQVEVSDLHLDLQNSRFPRDATSQDDAFLLMMTTSGEHCLDLLRDLVRSGEMNSADLPIVVKRGDHLVVVEGNRRLTCLRIWTDSSILEKDEHLSDRYQDRAERIIAEGSYAPPAQIRVSISPSDAEANKWIERKHSGGAGGAGTVEWGAAMKDRRRARGNPSNRSRTLAFIELVSKEYEEYPEITDALEIVRTARYTMIQRFVNRVPVRERLGLDFADGEMTFRYGPPATAPIIQKVMTDFAQDKAPSGRTWARELDSVEDFNNYLNEYQSLLPLDPDSSGPPATSTSVADSPSAPSGTSDFEGGSDKHQDPGEPTQASDAAEDVDSRPARPTPKNDHIFRGLALGLFTDRIQELVRQTSLLSVTRSAEIASVMLRVILDLTCYQFLKSHGRSPERDLDKRIRSAILIIEPRAHEALGLAEETSQLKLAFHATTADSVRLVQYAVHNPHSGSTPSEVSTLATRYQPLLQAMNDNMGSTPIT